MPARDLYHDVVVRALVADGWRITDDPLRLSYGARDVYVDLAAELPLAAEKDGHRIAVEVKSFVGASNIRDLEQAVGQFVLYREILARLDPARRLVMALPLAIHETLFMEPIGQLMVDTQHLALLVFDPTKEVIVRWIR
jgi:CBS domain-containing protein